MMTDRSGCGLVEVTVLQSFEALTAGRPRAHVKSSRAVAGIEERIGLGPRYGYQVLVDLARPWKVTLRLVSGVGNFGDRLFDEPAADRYTESRQSHVGQLVLDAEAHRLAPVPVGLINGTTYRGGAQPPLEPFRVIAVLRKLLDDPRVSDGELLKIVGPPYSVTDCEISGDLAALYRGRRTEIRETGRITITDVPVPDPPEPPATPGQTKAAHRVLTGSGGVDDGPPFAAHLVIESLPGQVTTGEATKAITQRIQSRRWHDSHPELARRAGLPIADMYDAWPQPDVRIHLALNPGSDPAAVRDQLLAVDGVGWDATWAFPAPLASMLRSWVERHQSEDITESLTRLAHAIRRDERRGRS
jgi:DNA gyrase/topoisomerase IV subunit A